MWCDVSRWHVLHLSCWFCQHSRGAQWRKYLENQLNQPRRLEKLFNCWSCGGSTINFSTSQQTLWAAFGCRWTGAEVSSNSLPLHQKSLGFFFWKLLPFNLSNFPLDHWLDIISRFFPLKLHDVTCKREYFQSCPKMFKITPSPCFYQLEDTPAL